MGFVSLENEKFRLSVTLHGGNMVSLFDKVSNKELQWQGDEKYWRFQDVVIFPILGRPEGGFDVDGKTYSCPMAHGVARNEEFSLVYKKEDEMLLELNANSNTLSMYPYNFKLQLKYNLLDRGFHLTYIVSNNDGVQMPFQVGAHLGINLTDGINRVKFDGEQDILYYPYKNGLCADQTEVLLHGDGYDITQELYNKHGSLVLNRGHIKDVTLLRTDGLKLHYDIGSCVAMTIWAMNNGGRFVCIEPWWGLCDQNSTPRQMSKKALVNFVGKEPKQFGYGVTVTD